MLPPWPPWSWQLVALPSVLASRTSLDFAGSIPGKLASNALLKRQFLGNVPETIQCARGSSAHLRLTQIDRGLNWLFLVEMATIVIVAVFYLFYLNRVLGSLLGALLRWFLLWKQNVYFEVESIQFSPLGGRISFRDLRYYSRNQSLRVMSGDITFRYWFWHVRDDNDESTSERKRNLPCRVKVEFEGLEWFLYNRTPSYDAIIDHIVDQTDAPFGHAGSKSSAKASKQPSTARSQGDAAQAGLHAWWMEFLPVEIVAKTGSILLGNRATPTLLIIGFKEAVGSYSVVKSRSSCDRYKEVYDFGFENPKIVFRSNVDYDESMEEHGSRLYQGLQRRSEFESEYARKSTYVLHFAHFRRFIHALPGFKLDSVNAAAGGKTWRGLARYRINETAQSEVEYAKVTTLLECPEIRLVYYCDYAGVVPDVPIVKPGLAGLESVDIGNGDLTPEWGVDVAIKGAKVNYGPWTDRQRAGLMRVFTPPTFFDQQMTPRLVAGDQRQHTSLKIFVEFVDAAQVQVPTRQSSQDWDPYFRGRASERDTGGPQREYGWLELAVGASSTLQFVLPMVSGPDGFDTQTDVHLNDLVLTSSVHGRNAARHMLTVDVCRVFGQMPSPRAWHEHRAWTFGITLLSPDIRLIRDHTNLITDLVKDFTSGPPGSVEQFVPFSYHIDVVIKNYRAHLFLNDHNLIDFVEDRGRNTILDIDGEQLDFAIDIAADSFMPNVSEVKFDVGAAPLSMGISTHKADTHYAFNTQETANFCSAKHLRLHGSYIFYGEYDPTHVETLYLNVESRGVVFKLFGYIIRHMFSFRDNYFGDFTQSKTSTEHKDQGHIGDDLEGKWRPGTKDLYEVVLSLDVTDSLLVVPDTLYDCRSALLVSIPDVQVHLRNHEYFMELSANIDPIKGIVTTNCAAAVARGSLTDEEHRSPQLVLQGADIAAHRMFGPQPQTSTYICIWDFVVGRIKAELSVDDVLLLARIGTVFGASLDDDDNPLQPHLMLATDPDITFLTARIAPFEVSVTGEERATMHLSTAQDATVRLDDSPCERFLRHVEVDVPRIDAQALLPVSPTSDHFVAVASAETDLLLSIAGTSSNWAAVKERKLAFIEKQDALTSRCAFLYATGGQVVPAASHYSPVELPSFADRRAHMAAGTGLRTEEASSSTRRAFAQSTSPLVSRPGSEGDESDVSLSGTPAPTPTVAVPDESAGVLQHSPFGAYNAIMPLFRRSRHPLPASDEHNFSLVRGPRLVDVTPRRDPSEAPEQRLRSAFASVEQPDLEGESATFIKADTRSNIVLRLTPLIADHLHLMLEAKSLYPSVDHWLDSIQLEYLKAWKPVAASPSTLHLVIAPTALSLVAHQDVLLKERLGPASQAADEILARIEIDMLAPAVCVSQRSGPLAVDQHAHTFHDHDEAYYNSSTATPGIVAMRIFHADATPRSATVVIGSTDGAETVEAPALELHWTDCKLRMDAHCFRMQPSASLGDVKLAFADAAAELVLGSEVAWERAAAAAATGLTRARDMQALRLRHVFLALARLSAMPLSEHGSAAAKTAAFETPDPEFFVAASPLLDNSLTSFRQDRSWQAIAHLRHHLRRFQQRNDGETIHGLLNELLAPASVHRTGSELYDEAADIFAKWRKWEKRPDIEGEKLLLRAIFRPDISSEPTPPRLPGGARYLTLRLNLQSFRVNLLDLSQGDNRLAFTALELVGEVHLPRNKALVEVAIQMNANRTEASANPDILALVQHIIQVRAVYEAMIARRLPSARRRSRSSASTRPSPPIAPWRPSLAISASIRLAELAVDAHAHGISALARGRALTLTSDVTLIPAGLAVATLATLGELNVEVAEHGPRESKSADKAAAAPASDLLASMRWRRSMAHAVVSDREPAVTYYGQSTTTVDAPALHLLADAGAVRIALPRNILRIHRFIEDWIATSFPRSRIIFEALMRDISESRTVLKAPGATAVNGGAWLPRAAASVHVRLPSVEVELQVVPTLSAKYRLAAASISARTIPSAAGGRKVPNATCTFSLEDQAIVFATTGYRGQTRLGGEVLALPKVRVTAFSRGTTLEVAANLERVEIRLTFGVLDSALTAAQKFGRDIEDLLAVAGRLRGNRAPCAVAGNVEAVMDKAADEALWASFIVRLEFKGFVIAVEAPRAVQNIQAHIIKAEVRSSPGRALSWRVEASDLGLLLEQRTGDASAKVDRRDRLAYFGLDLEASNAAPKAPAPINAATQPATATAPAATTQLLQPADAIPLDFHIPRLQAVMQPAAVEALGGLVEHYTSEYRARRVQRQHAIEQAQQLLRRTIDVSAPGQSAPLLSRLYLTLRAKNFGLAIPLASGGIDDAPIPQQLRQGREAVLFSIRNLHFATSKGEDGHGELEELSIQFVASFDQHRKADYMGSHHRTRNRLLLPLLTGKVPESVATATGVSRQALASVTELHVDLEPSVATYVFRLIDVFHMSKDRFAQLASPENLAALGLGAQQVPSEPTGIRITPVDGGEIVTDDAGDDEAAHQIRRSSSQRARTVDWQAKFSFDQGEIRFHSRQTKHAPRTHRAKQASVSDARAPMSATLAQGHDVLRDPIKEPVFFLPGLDVMCDYRSRPEGDKGAREDLLVEARLHASNNTLYPSLLPFISELADAITLRMQRPSASSPILASSVAPNDDSAPAGFVTPQAISNWHTTVSLRIDKSSLTLSCAPEVQVRAALEWETGGFVFMQTPGSREVSCIARVNKVGISLAHFFASGANPKALRATLLGVNMSIILKTPAAVDMAQVGTRERRTMSIVVNVPGVAGEIGRNQLADALAFKQVWLDRLEALQPAPATVAARVKPKVSPTTPQPSSTLIDTLVAVRIDAVDLACDLENSGRITLAVKALLGRYKNEPLVEKNAHVSVEGIKLVSRGAVAGEVEFDASSFETTVVDQSAIREPTSLLSIYIRLGALRSKVDYENHRQILANIDPILITVTDDWREVDARGLQLAFSVKLGGIHFIAAAASVPNFIGVLGRCERYYHAEQDKAKKTILAPASTRRPAVSIVAEHMGRRGGADEISGSDRLGSPRITASLHMDFGKLCVAVFNGSFGGADAWRINLDDAGADLSRGIDDDGVVQRDLVLKMTSASASRIFVPENWLAKQKDDVHLDDWLRHFDKTFASSLIVAAPEAKITMTSWQVGRAPRIEYVFALRWGASGVMMSLNWGLYLDSRKLGAHLKALANEALLKRTSEAGTKASQAIPAGRDDVAPSPIAEEPAEPAATAPDPTAAADEADNVSGTTTIKTPTLLAGGAAPTMITYVSRGTPHIEHPQLRDLGQATPRILSGQLAKTPGPIHAVVVGPLEELLLLLTDVYETQLASRASTSFLNRSSS